MFPKDKEYDLVIVGGGLSGLAAAVAAGQKKLNTLVLEKGRTLGGDGNYVEGAMGVDSDMQKTAGISIDKTKVLLDQMDYSHYEANAPHFKKFIDESGATINWLQSLGVSFTKVGRQGESWPTIHSFEGGGHAAVQTLKSKAEDLGVEIVTSMSAHQLLQSNGHISGLVIKNEATGEFRDLTTSNVLLAAGGYVDNPELVKKRTPFTNRLMIVSDGKSTGDGLQLAWSVGAQHYSMGTIEYGGGALYDRQTPPFMHMASTLGVAATQEAILWVNERGERFVNEDVNDNMCHAGSAILTQSRVFSILNQSAIDHLTNVGLYKEVGSSPVSPDKLDKLPDEIESDLKKHASYLTKADTVADLAKKLGLTKLPDTIERYNDLVSAGADTDFGKSKDYLTAVSDGPFYAVELGVGTSCALGGIRVSDNNEVLNDYGYPVPGLYAAGNDAAGMLVGDTNAITLPGSTSGYAVFSGRNAVKNM